MMQRSTFLNIGQDGWYAGRRTKHNYGARKPCRRGTGSLDRGMAMRRQIFGVGACGALVALLAACGSGASPNAAGSTNTSGPAGANTASTGTVNVLAIVDTSGPNKAYGSQELLGLQAAAAYYNKNGGINGGHVVVTVMDDNGSPATATADAVKALSGRPGQYAMVYPGEEGTDIAALIPIIARYKAYAIALDDGNNGCANVSVCPTEFSLVGSAALPEVEAAQWMKSKGYTNVGVLEEQIDFTESETPSITSSLKSEGITAETAGFPATAVSVTAEMSQLKSAGAQAVFAEALGPAAGYALQARAQLGWNAPVLFDIAGSSLDISKLAPASELANGYETAPYCADPSQNIPALNLLATNSPSPLDGSIPCNLSGNGWDAMVLFHDAAAQAKSLRVSALVSATESLSAASQSDPNLIVYPHIAYTTTNHENRLNTPSDFKTLPIGTISGTQIKPLGNS